MLDEPVLTCADRLAGVVERRFLTCAVGAAAAFLLAGCSGQGTAQVGAATDAAREFVQARTGDPGAACRLLAPRTFEEATSDEPCPDAVTKDAPDLAGQTPRVEVYGKDAIARFDDDTVFLALFDTGWRVTAAGCQPRGQDLPYDCSVSGG